MALYKNIIHWDYDLLAGDYVSWFNYPFGEITAMNHIFKVMQINDDLTFNLKVIRSDFYTEGSVLTNELRSGYRRVKLSTIDSDNKYIKNS